MRTNEDKQEIQERGGTDGAADIRYLEKTVIDACLRAGRYIRDNAFDIKEIQWKKTDDPVTELDKNAEQMIRKDIGSRIDANFYGEEYGIDDKKKDITIFIDPIDGTKSFARGEYLSSVSIAAAINGEIRVGAVYDFMRDILYYASPEGAYMQSPNNAMPNSRKRLPFIDMTLSRPTISFSHPKPEDWHPITERFGRIDARKTIGSIALAMAQLAAGSYDGLIMRPYEKEGVTDTCDIAAGYYIMRQAGIHIKDYDLRRFDPHRPSKGIIALKPRIADMLNKPYGIQLDSVMKITKE